MILHPERIVLAFALALGGAAALVLAVKAGVALARWAWRPRGRNSAPPAPTPPPCPPQATRYSRHAASPDRVGYHVAGCHRYRHHLTLHPPEKP